jgi:hypothetical protein
MGLDDEASGSHQVKRSETPSLATRYSRTALPFFQIQRPASVLNPSILNEAITNQDLDDPSDVFIEHPGNLGYAELMIGKKVTDGQGSFSFSLQVHGILG